MFTLPSTGTWTPPSAGEYATASPSEVSLQFGVPGGPEILIILLVLLMLLLPVALVVLIVVGVLRLRGSGSTDDRVASLEHRVEELESELQAERSRTDEATPESEPSEERR